jgi:hypothetical protein
MGGELVDLAEENTFFLNKQKKKERKNQQVGVVSIYMSPSSSPLDPSHFSSQTSGPAEWSTVIVTAIRRPLRHQMDRKSKV